MKKRIVVIALLLLTAVGYLKVFQNKNVYAEDAEIYDVILFWGQSNMQGYMTENGKERFDNSNASEVKNISSLTRIDEDILANTTSMSYVKIAQEPNTVYEYKYLSNSLEEITENTEIFGEYLTYNNDTGKLKAYVKANGDLVTSGASNGTNMIPEFCRVYYKQTGHKVVAVMCANGGQRLEAFLPENDEKYKASSSASSIYKGMVEKYQSAITCLQNKGYTIGNKLYVCCQGESNVSFLEPEGTYSTAFLKLHNYLKKDLGISRGMIVETARKPGEIITGENVADEVELLHKERLKLVNQNSDILLGSSYAYDWWIPCQETYELTSYFNKNYTDSNGNKLSYSESYTKACYSVCAPNNLIHFTSAALTQMGRESAMAFTDIKAVYVGSAPTKNKYIQNYETLNLQGGKLKIEYNNGTIEEVDMTNGEVKVSGFDNTKLGKNTIQVTYKGKTTSFEVNIVAKTLASISVKEVPSKTEYIQNYEELNLAGGEILLQYNDETTEKVDMTNEEVKASGFDNTKLGKNTIQVTYKGKTTSFEIEIKEETKNDVADKNEQPDSTIPDGKEEQPDNTIPEEKNEKKDNTIATEKIPYTGNKTIILVIISASIGLAIFFKTKYNRIHIN